MSEQWAPISDWEDLYEVSTAGRVRSLRSGRVMLASAHESGHLVVTLRESPRKRQEYIHRLVATAFIPNPEGHPFILHWDDDPSNNRVENLRWGTRSDNAEDALRNGRNYQSSKTHCIRGHEFTPENTRAHGEARYCIACNTLLARESRARRREAA